MKLPPFITLESNGKYLDKETGNFIDPKNIELYTSHIIQNKDLQSIISSRMENTTTNRFYFCCGLKMQVYGTMVCCEVCGEYVTSEKHRIKKIFIKLKL